MTELKGTIQGYDYYGTYPAGQLGMTEVPIDSKNQIWFTIYKRDTQPDELDSYKLSMILYKCDTLSWDFHFENIMNIIEQCTDLDEMFNNLSLYCSLEPPKPVYMDDGIYGYELVF